MADPRVGKRQKTCGQQHCVLARRRKAERRRRREDVPGYRLAERERQNAWRENRQRAGGRPPKEAVSQAEMPRQALEIWEEIDKIVARRLSLSQAQINRDVQKILHDSLGLDGKTEALAAFS